MKKIKKIGRDAQLKISSLRELITFLWKQKLWWMIPMVTILVFFGIFLIAAQGTSIIHFIYPLF
ncbi:hypothetical protein A3D84_01880 [Candidatus Woesebacteria bacterium RIFCSPHIGHO2_02_FULL_42_20]|uniref:Uncharacterized protein n=1 Tax=Candidatus Woesebacteria bacterium RIFCSPHIGHO2_12_FULL_41_24 TaxID=1802510 RepID=A0A1F8ASY3_9BACT|nr:MAG: hypothetical protein A2W15_04165 [Candidatus Woesebacteria bacterium RBG_16_41_13]OGM29997.1 MAG: hypothetical protein A2873_04715 [Candidatus Woesebacteria bacterium RIFCSPHIGHO2_01_FULL_42_80]OGM35075.1 MAG: hypothetical protein A3D84_01880 [Candidatus Woesebacteria bacterium RIFCSPHIGHO2_02_FULL_42_20]OGM54811.1 MAG: hypothetical protein A3E44_01480 [Candidatus Woesebacteria bacterium RIFCSPHIGHO2_12_FULL_41_24]OGM67427.1 MAG: hypothetical protein A2969_05330 [Candidatus Woesebacteri